MVDGLHNNVIFIIQARMESTRLPGKVLMPIPINSNKPLISWINDELLNSKYYYKTIIATSLNPTNDCIEKYAIVNEINCYRGEEDDVLSRFIAISKAENCEHIVRFTADNPIIDIGILDKFINFHISNNFDYSKSENLPIGMNFEIIKKNILLELEEKQLSFDDKEHVTLYIRKNDYKNGVFKVEVKDYMKDIRLTVDYPSDYLLVSWILENQLIIKKLKGVELIDYLFSKNNWIFLSNVNNYQKKNFSSKLDELTNAISFLKNNGFDFSSDILIKYKKCNEII
jgi:spore coat polysaccharide biosynthesis protein SpsF